MITRTLLVSALLLAPALFLAGCTRLNDASAPTHRVTVGDDKILHVNGDPLFPTIFIQTMPVVTTERLAGLKAFGITSLAGHADGDNGRLLDMAEANGLTILLRLTPKRGTFQERKKDFDQYVRPVMKHPALLGYLLSDEPALGKEPQEELLRMYNYLKQVDPYHPVWMNHAPRDTIECLAEYNKACDITGVDIYPVPSGKHSDLDDRTITCVGQYAERMSETVAGQKPVWMVLQGFAWQDITGRRKATRYPTHRELRLMTYDSIVRGSQGIAYWGMNTIQNLDYWGTLLAVTSELETLRSALASHNTTGAVTVRAPTNTVICVHKRTAHGEYIIAVNEAPTTAEATFETTSNNPEMTVACESRSVTVNNGVFRDTFAPYDVHIYTTDSTIPQEPFPAKTPDFIEHMAYWGDANWIWAFPNEPEGKKTAYFRREFVLDRDSVRRAFLYFTTDRRCETLCVNGQTVDVQHYGWRIMEKHDITDLLRQGKNLLAMQCVGYGKNAALLFDVEILMKDGSVAHILSDAQCLAANSPSRNWHLLDDGNTMDWPKAKVRGKYGINPWSNIYPFPIRTGEQALLFQF